MAELIISINFYLKNRILPQFYCVPLGLMQKYQDFLTCIQNKKHKKFVGFFPLI